jgi:LysM repeat protein
MGPLPGAPPSPANGRPGVADPFASGNPAPPAGPSSVASNPATGGSLPASPAAQPDAYRPTPEAAALNSLEVIMQQVKQKVSEERFGDALLILSQVYGSPDLPPSQSREITQILDQMAAKVIYSRENWLENPYLVQPGDTLDAIADRYQVPALLLARINGIRDPQNLPPGKSLKVLTGKFSAHVSTDRSELTMMLAGRYAGRFPISLSNDVNRSGGLFTVMKRSQNPTSGVPGSQWLELAGTGGTISIQGTSSTGDPSGGKTRNTIWLSEQDMDDVYGILSVGSRVIIQR